MPVYQAIIEIDGKAKDRIKIKTAMDKLISEFLDKSGVGILLGSSIDANDSPITIGGQDGP